MVLFISLIITFVYLYSWVKFQQYQFLERDYNIVHKHKEYSQKWHKWKLINSTPYFLLFLTIFGFAITFINVMFYYILFEGIFNRKVLNKEFFYVGTTAVMDKKIQQFVMFLRKFKPLRNLSPQKFSAILKLTLLASAIFLYF